MIITLSSFSHHTKSMEYLFSIYKQHGSDIRLVGGCVRDALLSLPCDDIDLATPLPPAEGLTLLRSHGITVKTYGLSHGTITPILDSKPYEITTLRRDVKTFGRQAEVAFGTSWEEDAKRRDFTMNALYADETGAIYDYVDGVADAQSGTVRFVGNPQDRIPEDFLRILRLFRFYAFYGKQPLSPEALTACKQNASNLRLLSRERIKKELEKLLKAPSPYLSLTLMNECDIFSHLGIGPYNSKAAEYLIALEKNGGFVLSSQCRLFCLFPEVSHYLEALCPSRSERKFAHLLEKTSLKNLESEDVLKPFLYNHGLNDTRIVYIIKACQQETPLNHLLKILTFIQSANIPPFPLTGTDILTLDTNQTGPRIGLILKDCFMWWILQTLPPSKEACLEWIKTELTKRQGKIMLRNNRSLSEESEE